MLPGLIKSLLKRYGQPVSVQIPGLPGRQYGAVIQPLRYKNKLYLEGDYTPVGYYGSSTYLYIGPADPDIGDHINDTRLFVGDAEYFFVRADIIRLKNQPVYTWAVIKPVVA